MSIHDGTVTDDRLFDGWLHVRQPTGGHRAGTDAVLLAATAPITTGLVIDVGAGVGTVGLALAKRDRPARTILVERESLLADLARHNVGANGLAECAQVIETDVFAALPRRNAGVKNDSADLVVTNPPFFDAAMARVSPDRLKERAHVLEGSLEDWLRVCVTLLRSGGTLALIHRTEALPKILSALAGRTGRIKLRPVHPHAMAGASRVLVTAVKGSRAPLELLSPLVLHDPNGDWTPEMVALQTNVGGAA